MPFNPITLEYEKSDEGLSLMEKDEQAKVQITFQDKLKSN